jgi:hypothetical protein
MKVAQQHWAVVEQLAETLRGEKSLSPERVLELLLKAGLNLLANVASDV